ncbi:MAG: DUF6273 domain-containing protein [Oscillospiraceae bacterium]
MKTLKDIPVGGKIWTRYKGLPFTFLVANTGNKVTVITEKILETKATDGLEATNPSAERAMSGNNRYSLSNINTWLNSTAAANFYISRHAHDTPPSVENVTINPYDTAGGFLYNFTENFAKSLLISDVRVALCTNLDGGGFETISAKMFLPSADEVGLNAGLSVNEGVKLALFKDNASRIAKLGTVSGSWWLRTPEISDGYSEKIVNSSGLIEADLTIAGEVGIRPMCCLSPDTIVAETATADGFEIISTPLIVAETTALGEKTDAFSVDFSTRSLAADVLTVTAKLGEKPIFSTETLPFKAISVNISDLNFGQLANGANKLTVRVANKNGAFSEENFTFTKAINSLSARYISPISAAKMPIRIKLSCDLMKTFLSDITVFACNNGFDEFPIWENVTNSVCQNTAHVFKNSAKAAQNWGVNVKIKVNRNSSVGEISLGGIRGDFE